MFKSAIWVFVRLLLSFCILTLLTSCSYFDGRSGGETHTVVYSPYAKGKKTDQHEQCVPFARRASGIQIRGDAHTWWRQADPEKRFKDPKPGAVMVLSKTRRLSLGHLAVVTDLVNEREINVTHTNWGWDRKTRMMAYDYMRVKDVSKAGDWSQAVFWNPHGGHFGSPYKVSGFIYP